METGILIKSMALACPPCAIFAKVVNRTMTKISSQDAPAKISCGILFSVPYLCSISCTMRGTTIAGETAPRTAPMTAASIRVMPSRYGANRKYPKISKLAGRQDISTAGRPTFFKSAIFRESPAFKRMIISAILRSSAEMDKIEGSNQSST